MIRMPLLNFPWWKAAMHPREARFHVLHAPNNRHGKNGTSPVQANGEKPGKKLKQVRKRI